MEATKGTVSAETLVSSDSQYQRAEKLPQYVAAIAGNVGENNFAELAWLTLWKSWSISILSGWLA
jgi:hypothetical protein